MPMTAETVLAVLVLIGRGQVRVWVWMETMREVKVWGVV